MALQRTEIVRDGLPRQVAELIREAIIHGRLATDERLPTEEELARRFGISRPTVREALKILAAQNLIRSRRGPTGGTFVNALGDDAAARSITDTLTLLVGMGRFKIDEILTARMQTEALCCRLAAQNHSESDLMAMAAEIDLQQNAALSDEDFCVTDVRFHRAIVRATNNAPLQLMMYAMIESFIPITNMLIYRDHERRRSITAHKRIHAAIAAGDAELAAQLIQNHVEGMRAILDKALTLRNTEKSHGGHL